MTVTEARVGSWQSMQNQGSMLTCPTGGVVRSMMGPTYVINQILCGYPTIVGVAGWFQDQSHTERNPSYHKDPAICANSSSLLVGAGSPVSHDWHFDRAYCRQILFIRQ